MTGEQFDDPNRQAVGLDPAWVEGTGGDSGEGGETPPPEPEGGEPPPEPETAEKSLDEMTKDELLAEAQALGVTPANASMTKDELRAAIEAAS